MANLKEWILQESGDEYIQNVVIGSMGWESDYNSENVPNYEQQPKNKLLTWEEAIKWLDYDFDNGFGAPGCNAIYAWTENKVIFVSQYDGATSIESVPRHPIGIDPTMPGS